MLFQFEKITGSVHLGHASPASEPVEAPRTFRQPLKHLHNTLVGHCVTQSKKKKEVLAYLHRSHWRFDVLKSCKCEVNTAPAGLTTQGEHKPLARLSSESRHSQSKLLRNRLNFCKPPPRSYGIKPACTCMNE